VWWRSHGLRRGALQTSLVVVLLTIKDTLIPPIGISVAAGPLRRRLHTNFRGFISSQLPHRAVPVLHGRGTTRIISWRSNSDDLSSSSSLKTEDLPARVNGVRAPSGSLISEPSLAPLPSSSGNLLQPSCSLSSSRSSALHRQGAPILSQAQQLCSHEHLRPLSSSAHKEHLPSLQLCHGQGGICIFTLRSSSTPRVVFVIVFAQQVFQTSW